MSIIVLLFVSNVFAEPRFGAEFTFTNKTIVMAQPDRVLTNSIKSEKYRDLLVKKILSICKGCTSELLENKYYLPTPKITYPDGFYFIVDTDPGVIEVQTRPQTVREIKKNINRLQADLFDAAAEINLFPHLHHGGGHIHMSVEGSVNDNVLLMRNLIVDFVNHPGLSTGILERDFLNAPPLTQLHPENLEAFRRVIEDVDNKKIRSPRVLAERVNTEVYTWNQYSIERPDKFQALNLIRIAEEDPPDRTFEFRAIRAQKTAGEFLILTRMLEGRMAYLKRQTAPIPIKLPEFDEFEDLKHMKAFSKYLAQSGINLKEFTASYDLPIRYVNATYRVRQTTPKHIYCEMVFQ